MINNEDGFIIPKIDESRCIKCGLCEKKCIYLNKVISNSKTDITASSCYMMYFLNDKILESASGGIFYGIAVKAIELGYEVCGCIYLPYFVPFYLDLREFGIFIGSIFLGFLMARIYKKLKVNNSSYYQSLYLMLILLLVRLTLRFYFTRSDYIMAIVYTIFLYTWKFKIKSKREDVLKNE